VRFPGPPRTREWFSGRLWPAQPLPEVGLRHPRGVLASVRTEPSLGITPSDRRATARALAAGPYLPGSGVVDVDARDQRLRVHRVPSLVRSWKGPPLAI